MSLGKGVRREEEERRGVFTRRAIALGLGQLGLFGFLGTRLWRLQSEEGERYRTLAEENRLSARLIPPPRGQVLDRNGRVVAGNRLNWRALLVAEQTQDVGATLETFSRIVPLQDHEKARIERDVRRRRRFVPVAVREFLTWEEMARIEVNAPDLPGILIDVGTTRLYPEGEHLAHLVGYVAPPAERDMDGDPLLELPGIRVGRAGVEKHHDLALRGRAGAVQLEVNAVGRVIRELDRREGVPGQDVQLSVDAELQKALRGKIEEGTSIVVMDARNGEVLAMASQPSFDPSIFNAGVSAAQWRDWTRNRATPLINKATNGLYAPGSTFKMVVALAGLEARVVTPGDRIFCPGHLDLGDTRFHCWQRRGHGSVDMRTGIKLSCDVYFYEVAKRVGIDRIAAMANRFGLGVDLEIELPGTKRGLVPTRAWRQAQGKAWNLGDTIVHGIGQGFYQLTPLQLATMTARLATGRAVQPHVTRAINGRPVRGTRSEDWPSLGIPERDLRLMREGMWAVVNEPGGTALASRLPGPLGVMAGKTGSVQVRRISREQRERGFKTESLPREWRPHALFVAFAPYENPIYAVSVVVEHGMSGSGAAAPLARDTLVEVFNRFRAPPAPPPTPGQRVAEGPRT
ncbi:penicillin-binding protein 2 [Paracraurococcus ruber]|uniref:Penicillin-binding protein 2 n=1 Tax=Paracraurococcus ruber TaxID=77675 RepID=A0ABS1CVB8_9PROT|nr:penicillin-binding protein 2 [Paracraurococcus ruber]MBK1657982.1 penicillin-binding protein 2 [Paracraurococcus ruber]TDG30373.1 penicillin-binding protein 2 [Paracraurococcus ruber]